MATKKKSKAVGAEEVTLNGVRLDRLLDVAEGLMEFDYVPASGSGMGTAKDGVQGCACMLRDNVATLLSDLQEEGISARNLVTYYGRKQFNQSALDARGGKLSETERESLNYVVVDPTDAAEDLLTAIEEFLFTALQVKRDYLLIAQALGRKVTSFPKGAPRTEIKKSQRRVGGRK